MNDIRNRRYASALQLREHNHTNWLFYFVFCCCCCFFVHSVCVFLSLCFCNIEISEWNSKNKLSDEKLCYKLMNMSLSYASHWWRESGREKKRNNKKQHSDLWSERVPHAIRFQDPKISARVFHFFLSFYVFREQFSILLCSLDFINLCQLYLHFPTREKKIQSKLYALILN